MKDTKQQFEHVIAVCRELFSKKLHDYGPAWRILRPSSVTDQIFIKANRIRSIETKGVALVDEGIRSEFIAIVNYGIVGLIQLELGYAESADISNEEALALYDEYLSESPTNMDYMLNKSVLLAGLRGEQQALEFIDGLPLKADDKAALVEYLSDFDFRKFGETWRAKHEALRAGGLAVADTLSNGVER